jgi:hypothetical protein
MPSRIKEKLNRLKTGFKSGGFDYLLHSLTSYFPEWLLRYYHTFLFEGDELKLITRKHKDYIIRFATEADAGNLDSVDVDREKALHRLRRGDTCVIVMKDECVVSVSWAATGRLYNRFAGSIIDTGGDGVMLYAIYSRPEERLKGFFASCFKMQIEHYQKLKRNKKYGVVESLNTNSIKTHLRLGFEITGETFYIAIAGISVCYYKKWPYRTRKIHIFFRRPPENLEWV